MKNDNINTVYKSQSSNVFKTWLYLLMLSLLVGLIGYLLASYFQNPLFFYLGSFISIGTSIWSYWFSSSMVLKMANANELEKGENQDLEDLVRDLSREAGLPTPRIYIVTDPSPNAFATGRNPEHGVVAFTTGILSLLNRDELAGVIAHELSHIANRDTLIMTVVAVIANIIQSVAHFAYFFGGNSENRNSNLLVTIATTLIIAILAPLAATVIQLAISRKREFLADATAAKITKRPQDLASALTKIENFPQGMQQVDPSIAHLFIATPEKEEETHHIPWYMKLFMTHPPTRERVDALLGK